MNTPRIFGGIVSLSLLLGGCGPASEPVATTPSPSVPASPPAVERPAPAAQPATEEPDEETLLTTRAIKENCLICHSSDIIESQRLTAKQWKGEVEKMVGWGSPLPPEQLEAVITFLGKNYPDSLARATPRTWSLMEAVFTIAPEVAPNEANGADVAKGEASFAMNCKNCHGANGEGSNLGPNLVEHPVLLRPTDFIDVIHKGRGRMPMLGPLVDKSAGRDIMAW